MTRVFGDDVIIFTSKSFQKSADSSFSKKGLLIDWPFMKGGAKLEQKTVRKGTHRESPLAKSGYFLKQKNQIWGINYILVERKKRVRQLVNPKFFFEKDRANNQLKLKFVCTRRIILMYTESKPLLLGGSQLILRSREIEMYSHWN